MVIYHTLFLFHWLQTGWSFAGHCEKDVLVVGLLSVSYWDGNALAVQYFFKFFDRLYPNSSHPLVFYETTGRQALDVDT